MPDISPRNVLQGFITRRAASPAEEAEAFRALAEMRDPPSPTGSAAWVAPDPKAVQHHG